MPARERPGSFSSDLSTSSPNFFRVPVADLDAGLFTPTDNLSSLDSDDHIIHEYAPIMPPIVHYQPIQIPRPPTLEEVLQQASDSTELEQVKSLKLCVIADDYSLQLIASYCPRLTSLNLEGSALNTLRELGCMLTCLRFLNVSRCGLDSTEGCSGLESLTHFVANNNRIEYLDDCRYLKQLEELSVQGNVIRTSYNLFCLCTLRKLRTLHINGNPIEEQYENLQEQAKNIIPSLIFINGVRVREEEPGTGGCNEDSLSSRGGTSSSGSFSSLEKSLESLNIHDVRGAEPSIEAPPSPGPSNYPPPPTSSAVASLLSRERPLSGSLFRLRERHMSAKYKLHSIDSDDEPECIFPPLLDKIFPLRLPQTPVELELGVLLERAPSVFKSPEAADDIESLKKSAEQWRRKQKLRLKRPESAKGRLPGYDVIKFPTPLSPAPIVE